MFRLSFDSRPLVENSKRISVSVLARDCYLRLKQKMADDGKNKFNLAEEECVRDLIEMIEKGMVLNLRQQVDGKIETSSENNIQLTYSRSNLNKGFILWFLCKICGRKARYLYVPPNSQTYACRTCHRLSYSSQNESKELRRLAKLI